MITVKDVLDKGFKFVEGDEVKRLLRNKFVELSKKESELINNGGVIADGYEVGEFAWRKNTGEIPCYGDLLIDVKFQDGSVSIFPMPANDYEYGGLSKKYQITHWKPSLKNWENKMNVDNIESTEQEEEAFNAMGKEVKWDGEGLPPVGAECEFRCDGLWGDSDYHWCRFLGLLTDGAYAIEFHHKTSPDRVTCMCFDPQCTSFRKPETQEQKAERERVEAAYDLYCTCGIQHETVSFKEFQDEYYDAWLAIVDKTGYRKGDDNE